MSSNNKQAESVSSTESEHVLRSGSKPIVGITMGDPAGIGPEIVLKALADEDILKVCTPVVVGDLETMRRTADTVGVAFDFETVTLNNFTTRFSLEKKSVLDLGNVPPDLTIGLESAVAGKASGEYIKTAVDLCQSGFFDAVATAPINKRSFNAGGFDFPGHTEFLASLTKSPEFAMSFFAEKLRVVLLSIHVSLAEAIRLVKKDSIVDLIRFADREFAQLLGRKIKIAVAGLNPHASEGGKFGNEEATEISPAILECREKFGIDVSGPFSPDTIYLRGFEGEFDAVIACYHDQATIAVKCLSFGKGVNVTLGLPIIRTSVDHGTAFEIAGTDTADCGSMKAAIVLAAELFEMRTREA